MIDLLNKLMIKDDFFYKTTSKLLDKFAFIKKIVTKSQPILLQEESHIRSSLSIIKKLYFLIQLNLFT